MGVDDFSLDPFARLIVIRIEQWSGQSFSVIRAECERQTKLEGRYTKELREKLAKVRWALQGMDGYERISHGCPTAFVHQLANVRGLNLPFEERQKIKELVWAYLGIDPEKDKDSLGASLWKGFVFHSFWATHKH